MSAVDWFCLPRSVLTVSVLVTSVAAVTLASLGWKMLQQEGALEVQRSQDRLEAAADRAVSIFQREITGLEKYLSRPSGTGLPESTVALTDGRHSIHADPPGVLLYFPAGH